MRRMTSKTITAFVAFLLTTSALLNQTIAADADARLAVLAAEIQKASSTTEKQKLLRGFRDLIVKNRTDAEGSKDFDRAVEATTRLFTFEPLFSTFLKPPGMSGAARNSECQKIEKDLRYNYSLGRPENTPLAGDSLMALKVLQAFCSKK